MIRRRIAVALAASLAVILSAPFAQQIFTEVGNRWPGQFRAIGIGATAVPAGAALLVALFRIRNRRPARYLALASSIALGGGYILLSGLSFAESFHFVEYGVLGFLFYRVWRRAEDVSLIVLPMLAGTIVGTLDEWVQWFVPIRAGEARDVGLNGVALGCGLLFAIAADPLDRVTLALRRESRVRVGAWAAAAVILFGLFFQSVHLGYDLRDEEIGVFRSRYTPRALAAVRDERAAQWRVGPPLVQRRVSREDQYLSEGLRHVQRRNQAWTAGDIVVAWRENRILEKHYAPVLDTPSYSSRSGHRWPPEQHADAATRAAGDATPFVSDVPDFTFYVWPRPIFWGAHAVLLGLLVALCRPFSS